MKGILNKTQQGWVVSRIAGDGREETIPLHHIDVSTCIQYTDYSEDWTGKEVEFEIIHSWENGEVGVNGLSYAKLIDQFVDINNKVDERKGSVLQDHLETLAKVLAKTWFYGDWKWETPNERVMHFIMVELGLYPFLDEDSMIAKTQVSEEYYRLAAKYVKSHSENEIIDKDFSNLKKNLERIEYWKLGYNTAKRSLFTQEEMIEWTMCMIAQYAVGNTNIWDRELLRESLPKK
jgi:hypothetical protein